MASMQGIHFMRLLAVLALGALCACAEQNTTAGQTPAPGGTTLAQSNSTAAPDQAQSVHPGQKYVAKTGAVKDVTFEVWANGQPIGSIAWPNKALDITKDMRGHANVLVIKWTKMKKDGAGTLSIETTDNKKVLSANVTAASPAKGSVLKTMIAPKAPAGNQSM
jgi:hypothetical protein